MKQNNSMSGRNKLVLLLISSLLLAIQGCSSAAETSPEDGKQTEAAGVSTEVTAAAAETETAGPVPELPEGIDMGGKTFTILTEGFYAYDPLQIVDISTDDLNGEIFNDSIYNRNTAIEAKYNCEVKQVETEANEPFVTMLTKSVMSNSQDYDAVLLRGEEYTTIITNDYLRELDDLEYADFDKPWWDRFSMEQLSICGRHYVITSGITTTDEVTRWCIYFNKSMVKDYDLENPYTIVTDGKWTLDKMISIAKSSGISADLDQNGKWDNQDRYGITHLGDTSTGMMNAFGVKIADMDKDGIPYLTLGEESAISKTIDLIQKFSDETVFFNVHIRSQNPNADETGMFLNNQSLFSVAGIYYCRIMRQMEQDFGILPYPKYDEEQTRYYYPTSATAITLLGIPMTNDDMTNTSIFLEDYAYMGYSEIMPAFYDTLLRGKITRDEESNAMLDLIFSDTFLDIGNICRFGGIPSKIYELWGKHQTDVASMLEMCSSAAEKEIESLVSTFDERS